MKSLKYIFLDEDFTPFINTDADLEMFQQMIELGAHLHKPLKECYLMVIEIDRIRRILMGLKPLRIIPINYEGETPIDASLN